MLPAFKFKIGHQIQKNFVTLGYFDGKHPSLAIGTSSGKVLIHSPHESESINSNDVPQIRFLNFNNKITALTSGRLDENSDRDILFIGSSASVLAYDVERNADIFFKNIDEGVNALAVGKLTNHKPLLFSGGNCSVYGFNSTGTESFWTVTGGDVSSLALCDINSDGLYELLVGSDDYEIRTFQNEELISEQSESDKIIFLKNIERGKFAYALANGTVGVYTGPKTRAWRVKTKHSVTALEVYDINGDGELEVITAWSNGTLNVRNIQSGETIFKTTVSEGNTIAAIVCGDYRQDGKEMLIVCCSNGEIHGYLPIDAEVLATTGETVEISSDQKILESLQQQKAELTNELRLLDKNFKAVKTGDHQMGELPADTNLTYSMLGDLNQKCIVLTISAGTDVQVTTVVLIDSEGILSTQGEIITVFPQVPGKQIQVPLRPVKNAACQIRVQTHVAVRGFNTNLYVFEEKVNLPRFASLLHTNDLSHFASPLSSVAFRFNEDITRLPAWIDSSFILTTTVKVSHDKLNVMFVAAWNAAEGLPEAFPVILQATKEGNVISMQIVCDSMDLASDIVQDLAKYFKISELDSIVNYPKEMSKFEEVLKRVSDYNSLRLRMTADMAEESQKIKALIVRAEDSRLMVDMETMRRAYTELYSINNQLISGYSNRVSGHENLMAALKEVNQMIQRVANFRIGEPKARIINDCRHAVKSNNLSSLFRILKQGYDNVKPNSNSHVH